MRAVLCGLMVALAAGCASTPSGSPEPSDGAPVVSTPRAEAETREAKPEPAEKGTVDVDVSDVNGKNLPARLELLTVDGTDRRYFEITSGVATVNPGVGNYYAFVYVYDANVPVMVHAQELTVTQEETAYIPVTLLEGASGKLSVHDYDQDNDLAIDKVELIAGTDPEDPRSIPGRPLIPYDNRVFLNEDRWYKGELHAVSTYGGGQESVAELVARAEKAGLDFLAIADINTMAACNDPAFRSDSVVLIPAMAWGTPEKGYGLIYGPATLPDLPGTMEAAQAECIRVQGQGGVFAIAHPCFPDAPWLWGLSFVNAVEVWTGPWRSPEPLRLADLSEDEKIREDGKLVRSIAAAAAVSGKTSRAAAAASRKDMGVSANDQAALFWDYELVRGAVSSAIAGGMVNRRSVPMGQPVTWIKAPQKSVAGILHGLRLGRTFVSSQVGGVEIDFNADALADGTVDVGVGGAVPLGVEVAFQFTVFNANGAKVQLLRDGHPILTKVIDSDRFAFALPQTTDFQSAYRVRVIKGSPDLKSGFGPVDVLALSSPIYAADIGTELLMTGPVDVNKTWVHVDSEFADEDPNVPGN